MKNRGFTLLEIIMAFTILLVGVVGIYSIFSVGLVSHKRAVDNTNSQVLAGAVFDDISANYANKYYDRNRNDVPDRGEDANNNGLADWFETTPIEVPYRRGYTYTVNYERSNLLDLELFVVVRVFWRQEDEERSEVFYRTVFIKNLPDYE